MIHMMVSWSLCYNSVHIAFNFFPPNPTPKTFLAGALCVLASQTRALLLARRFVTHKLLLLYSWLTYERESIFLDSSICHTIGKKHTNIHRDRVNSRVNNRTRRGKNPSGSIWMVRSFEFNSARAQTYNI